MPYYNFIFLQKPHQLQAEDREKRRKRTKETFRNRQEELEMVTLGPPGVTKRRPIIHVIQINLHNEQETYVETKEGQRR